MSALKQSTSIEQLRALIDLLEEIAADWRPLDELSADDARPFSPGDLGIRQTRSTRDPQADEEGCAGGQDGSGPARGSGAADDRHPHPSPASGRHDTQSVSAAGFPTARSGRRFDAPAVSETGRDCYICKKPYSSIHHFYDQLCPACAEENFAARTELADLRGRVALLTGGRVKIGYQAGLKLLRCGARLIVTTRFPRNAAARYARGARLCRLERSPRDLRPRPASHTERRGVLPRSRRDPRPAGLHHQQRVSDRPSPARVLRAHDGGRERGASQYAGSRAPSARRI